MTAVPTCAFCGQDKPLIDAHIIPRAFYPPRAAEGDAVIIPGHDSREFPRRTPIGVYDKAILCAECDGKLGRLDQHAAEHLLHGVVEKTHLGKARLYPKADPVKIARFVASVAWRGAVSSHMMFRTVNIGAYERRILDALRNNDDDVPLDVWIAEFDAAAPPFLNPHLIRIDGVLCLVIYASRFIFYAKTDRQRLPVAFAELALRPGKPVRTILRAWGSSKEANLMRKMLTNPKVTPTLRAWESRRRR